MANSPDSKVALQYKKFQACAATFKGSSASGIQSGATPLHPACGAVLTKAGARVGAAGEHGGKWMLLGFGGFLM